MSSGSSLEYGMSNLNITTPLEPTTLRSLQRYAPRQTELIESLLDPSYPNSHFRDPYSKHWVQFWLSAWDKDPDSLDVTEGFDRGPDATDEPIFLDEDDNQLPPRRDVMLKSDIMDNCWLFKCEKILIRSEYKEAEEFILSTRGAATVYDALLIVGDTGIGISPFCLAITGSQGLSSGRSVFLLRTLLRRLALKLPTALQIEPNRALLFYQGGVKEFTQLNSGSAYNPLKSTHDPLGRIWALVGSNLHEPATVFQESPFFVIGASTYNPVRHEWIRKIRTGFFYMKRWSLEEVMQVRSLIEPAPPSEKKLSYMHYMYGASLKDLFLFAERPEHYDNLINDEVARMSSPWEFYNLLRFANNATENFGHLASTMPLPDDRTSPERNLASKHIAGKVVDHLWGSNGIRGAGGFGGMFQ
ncbi:hypothetical protein BDM02DRAFT_3271061 [Thelephora ganbajun]|uniref:Uncharacterized protein n=1 Tax=Thelephora ganbajun TaxID=370292 RepID=A0ACB6Z9V9_THEGA|nr:hypothetical protein BDM02DRAFT_3271061 [Thelephora ganbajun]